MQSDLSSAFLVLWLIVAVTFSYATYWAFTIRRVLVHRLYRRQATWVGRMGVYFVALSSFLTLALSTGVSSLYVNVVRGLLIGSGFIVIFAWMDSTIRVARLYDSLLRATLRWSTLSCFLGFGRVVGAFE